MVSDFLKRLSAYPVVTSACERASAGLSWAKDRSSYARAAADIAESGLCRVADGAGPLVRRHGERLAELDRLACRQLLDRLETACPVVLQPTEEVAELGRSYYSDAVKPRVELVLSPVTAVAAKVQSAKSAGLNRYRQAVGSRQGQSGLRQFDQLIRLLGDCLDKCMPPGAEEKAASEPCGCQAADDEGEAEGAGQTDPEKDEARDPTRSLSLAIDLGRRVSARVADRVADGHWLVDRLLGRPASASVSSTAASTCSSSSTSTCPPPADADEAADESDEEESPDDASTD